MTVEWEDVDGTVFHGLAGHEPRVHCPSCVIWKRDRDAACAYATRCGMAMADVIAWVQVRSEGRSEERMREVIARYTADTVAQRRTGEW